MMKFTRFITMISLAIIASTLLLSAPVRAATPLPLHIDFEDMVYPEGVSCKTGEMYRELYGVRFEPTWFQQTICNLKVKNGGLSPWAPFIQTAGNGDNSYLGFPSGAFSLPIVSFPEVERVSFMVTGVARNSDPEMFDPHEFIDLRVDTGGAADSLVVLKADHARVTLIAKPGRTITGISISYIFLSPGVREPYIIIDDIDIGEKPPNELKLALENIHFTQVVQDFKFSGSNADPSSDADLVLGKGTAIHYDISAQGGTGGEAVPVTLSILSSDGTQIANRTISSSEIIGSTSDSGVLNSKTFVEVPYVPTMAGKSTITFQTLSSGKITAITKTVRVKKTNPLVVSYIPVSGAFDCPSFGSSTCSGPLFEESVEDYSKKSTEFLRAVFPIADSDISATIPGHSFAAQSWLKLPSAPVLSAIGITLTMRDILALAYQEVVTNNKADSFIGVVPRNYFDHRGLMDATGMSPSKFISTKIRTSFVEERYWTTSAHEIAHTLGVEHVPLSMTSGYWVAQKQSVNDALNMMLNDGGVKKASLQGQWIDKPTYEKVFNKQLINSTDPALLVIAGFIRRDGSVELMPLSYLPEGFESGVNPEDDSIARLLDGDGTEIAAASFGKSFSVMVTSELPIGEVPESDVAPFMVKLPYKSNAASIEILSQGEKIATLYPNPLLISDSIRRIAAASFNKNEEIERMRLLKYVEQIEQFATFCQNWPRKKFSSERLENEWREQCSKTQVNLAFNLREQVDRSLNESTSKLDPLDLVKNEALKNIDSAILRIIPEQTSYGSHKEYIYRVLPSRIGSVDNQQCRITSVTEGTYGNVRIENDGLVSYRPESSVKNDTFTVTITDAWGASVTKTMHITPIWK